MCVWVSGVGMSGDVCGVSVCGEEVEGCVYVCGMCMGVYEGVYGGQVWG